MAIARLTETFSTDSGTASANYDISVAAPASIPNGVCVLIAQTGSAADQVVSVTYGITTGAVPLTERRFVPITTEAGAVYLYWAGGVIYPAGAQTCRIVKTAAAAAMGAAVCPMTVAAGQQVAVDFDTSSVSTAAVANPSWSHVTVATATECYEAIVSGLQTMTATPRTSPVVWTLIGSFDAGTQGRGFARTTQAAAGEASPGWTAATAEDYAGASISFKEAALPAPSGYPQLRRMHPNYLR